MTDIKEPINTTSDGTFLSVVCENPEKVLLANSWGGHSPPPPQPPRNYPPATYYTDDPLWDGEGCNSTSTCCEFNSPPLFWTSLIKPKNDDLEIGNCYTENSIWEDNLITLIDIYVK